MAAAWLAPTWLQGPQTVLDRTNLWAHASPVYSVYQASNIDFEYVPLFSSVHIAAYKSAY